MQEPNLNPVSVVVALLSAYLGPQLGAMAGAYGAIVLGWCAGVIIGLWRGPQLGRWQLAGFVLVSFIITLGVTVTLAEIIVNNAAALLPGFLVGEARDLLFPLAVALPAIGHSWADVARWAWGFVQRRSTGGA